MVCVAVLLCLCGIGWLICLRISFVGSCVMLYGVSLFVFFVCACFMRVRALRVWRVMFCDVVCVCFVCLLVCVC